MTDGSVVQVATPDGHVDVDGYVVDGVPGLAVTRAPGNRLRWRITHLASGHAVTLAAGRARFNFASRPRADAVARLLGLCGDWTQTAQQIKADAELVRRLGLVAAVLSDAERGNG